MNNTPAILVVDDEIVNRSFAAVVLRSARWHVDEIEDGPAAIHMVRERRYALVLMDIQMPDMDGFEAARAIRAGDGPAAAVPILAFTALRREDAIGRAEAAGMDGFIAKPFTAEALIAAAELWRPDNAAHPAARLASIFGAAEIASLIERFRLQLQEALVSPDPAGSHRPRAHQIAGVAGTLGFADVSRTWLAVAEGDDSSWEAARIAARKALAQIIPETEILRRD